MNRRGFLKSLLGVASVTAAGIILPKVTYFLPPAQGWRPSEYTTYLVGKDAYFLQSPQDTLATYFDKRTLATIMANTRFIKMAQYQTLPAAAGDRINFYTYARLTA